jgi:outer membrane protein OmpU
MKKILIATTALVATAGYAAADITLSGYGRLGVVVDETAGTAAVAAKAGTALTATEVGALTGVVDTVIGNASTSNDELSEQITLLNAAIAGTYATNVKNAATAIAVSKQNTGASTATLDGNLKTAQDNLAALEKALAGIVGTEAVAAVAKKSTTSTYTRFLLDFNGSTVADNGFEFGAMMRLRATNGPTTTSGVRAHVKMGDVTVYGGNIPGPLDNMPNVYGKTVGFSGGTFQGLVTGGDKLAYSSAGNGAGAMQVDYSNGGVTVMAAHQPGTDINQAVISYTMDGLTVAAGGQFSKTAAEDVSVMSLGYNFGGVSFALASGENDKIRHSTLSASGSIGNGVSLSGYVSEKEKEKNNGWGLGISYDLGGGAKFAAGYETRFDKSNRAEAGFHFNF